MELNNVWFWILISINVLGFFIYKFSSMAEGAMKEPDKAIGLVLVLFSYVTVFLRFGVISFIVVLIAVPFISTPFLMFLLSHLERRLFPERIRLRLSSNQNKELPKPTDAKVINSISKPQPFNPVAFPTLVKYDSQMIEDAVQKLMKDRSMTRQQALVNLEQDLSEIESR